MIEGSFHLQEVSTHLPYVKLKDRCHLPRAARLVRVLFEGFLTEGFCKQNRWTVPQSKYYNRILRETGLPRAVVAVAHHSATFKRDLL